MDLRTTTLTTPVGPFTLLVDDDGGVCAAGFTGHAGTLQRRLDPPRRAARIRSTGDPGGVATAMRAYLAGDLEALEALTVTQPGDQPRQEAWRALRSVRAGRTISYRQLGEMAELADMATDPFGAQAAGAACARNNVAVIVPCHRVVGSDGRLTGYGWGLPRKQWLLAHESAMPTLLDQDLVARRPARP
ncbi:MAG TPA: methylated-DNA--[protein]-cysteine S-methyltransferase [Actinomycetota bacterium]|nr:methylated-DNA--[protein]-cysteine S-methyltransferase [Actinomycetota bacterium]